LPGVDRRGGVGRYFCFTHEFTSSLVEASFETIVVDIDIEPAEQKEVRINDSEREKKTLSTNIFSPSHDSAVGEPS
jgi:hypothetical protein